MRNMYFFRDKDLRKGSDDNGPENGHRGTHDGKVDFEGGDNEGNGVPPCEVEAGDGVGGVFEGGPKAEDGHQHDARISSLVCKSS